MNGADFPASGPMVARDSGPMMDLAEAAKAVGGRVAGPVVSFANVTTDSRSIATGDIFVALQGERFDGHAYVAEAFRRGAAAAITSREIASDVTIPQVVVADTR